MPSLYTSSLRLTLPATGENSGTWGLLVNAGITSLVDASIAGYLSIAMTDADLTLTNNNGAADQARNMMLNMTGTLTAARNVICPTASKLYIIKNATTGGFAITLKTSAGSGVSIPNGSSMMLMCNGTDVVEAITQFSTTAFTNLSYSGTLTGGTGVVNLGSGQFYKDASGNVGIGTATPATKLQVGDGTATTEIRIDGDGGSGNGSFIRGYKDTINPSWFVGDLNPIAGGTNSGLCFYSYGATPQVFYTNGLTRMTLDSSGNLGLGVTPSAWGVNERALQISNTLSLVRGSSSEVVLAYNTYVNSGGAYIYNITANSSRYEQLAGQHKWYTAPSGTAGNPISFTQAMTLDASGTLQIATLAGTGTRTVTADASGNLSASSSAGLPALNIVTGTTQAATAGNQYVLTNVAATTVTLPATPTAGDFVWVTVGNGLTTNIVARNGNKIQSIAEDLTLNAPYAAVQMRYINSTIGWTFV